MDIPILSSRCEPGTQNARKGRRRGGRRTRKYRSVRVFFSVIAGGVSAKVYVREATCSSCGSRRYRQVHGPEKGIVATTIPIEDADCLRKVFHRGTCPSPGKLQGGRKEYAFARILPRGEEVPDGEGVLTFNVCAHHAVVYPSEGRTYTSGGLMPAPLVYGGKLVDEFLQQVHARGLDKDGFSCPVENMGYHLLSWEMCRLELSHTCLVSRHNPAFNSEVLIMPFARG